MRCVVGLGNPGFEYASTRHNVGFMVLDKLATRLRCSFERHPRGSDVVMGGAAGESFLLAKPLTYMNRSGLPLMALVEEFRIEPSDLLVVVDDFYLGLGSLRIRRAGSHGGHNGLRSIIDQIGADFPRLRLGIGPAPEGVPVEQFVLESFPDAERSGVERMVKGAEEASNQWIRGIEVETLMNRYNGQT